MKIANWLDFFLLDVHVSNQLLHFWQGGITQTQTPVPQSESQQGNSFTLQLFQRTLEETLASFQKSIHEDMRNLHIEIIRQFHMQEVLIW